MDINAEIRKLLHEYEEARFLMVSPTLMDEPPVPEHVEDFKDKRGQLDSLYNLLKNWHDKSQYDGLDQ